MSDYNRVTMICRLVKEPEITYSESGVAIGTLRVANNYKSKEGEQETTFINVICFNGIAESAVQYLSKGSMILVDGRLRQRQWITEKGEKRSVFEIIAREIHFLDKKSESDSNKNIPNEAELYEEPF